MRTCRFQVLTQEVLTQVRRLTLLALLTVPQRENHQLHPRLWRLPLPGMASLLALAAPQIGQPRVRCWSAAQPTREEDGERNLDDRTVRVALLRSVHEKLSARSLGRHPAVCVGCRHPPCNLPRDLNSVMIMYHFRHRREQFTPRHRVDAQQRIAVAHSRARTGAALLWLRLSIPVYHVLFDPPADVIQIA